MDVCGHGWGWFWGCCSGRLGARRCAHCVAPLPHGRCTGRAAPHQPAPSTPGCDGRPSGGRSTRRRRWRPSRGAALRLPAHGRPGGHGGRRRVRPAVVLRAAGGGGRAGARRGRPVLRPPAEGGYHHRGAAGAAGGAAAHCGRPLSGRKPHAGSRAVQAGARRGRAGNHAADGAAAQRPHGGAAGGLSARGGGVHGVGGRVAWPASAVHALLLLLHFFIWRRGGRRRGGYPGGRAVRGRRRRPSLHRPRQRVRAGVRV